MAVILFFPVPKSLASHGAVAFSSHRRRTDRELTCSEVCKAIRLEVTGWIRWGVVRYNEPVRRYCSRVSPDTELIDGGYTLTWLCGVDEDVAFDEYLREGARVDALGDNVLKQVIEGMNVREAHS